MKPSQCSIYDGLLGAIVGDYIGLPFCGKSRESLADLSDLPAEGHGSYDKDPGTWGAPGSLLLATVSSLTRCEGKINYGDLMDSFAAWILDGAFTPDADPLPGGSTIAEAIGRYRDGLPALSCGSSGLRDNGNGALIRILPLAYVKAGDEVVCRVAALTHGRLLSQLSCLLYVTFARSLLKEKLAAPRSRDPLVTAKQAVADLLKKLREEPEAGLLLHAGYFNRLTQIKREPVTTIHSTAYVVDSLEAALWSFLTTETYMDCILKAVRLGYATNSTASLAGGLAGIWYGAETIPEAWLAACRNLKMIQNTADQFDHLAMPV